MHAVNTTGSWESLATAGRCQLAAKCTAPPGAPGHHSYVKVLLLKEQVLLGQLALSRLRELTWDASSQALFPWACALW